MTDPESSAVLSGVAPSVEERLGKRHGSLSKVVADELRRGILTGRRKPGDRLVEDRLSAELGVSRVPIREALRLLAAEGLVEVQPRRGASVAEFSAEVAHDLVEVRAMLEGLNARLAARHRAPAIIAELRQVLAEGNTAAQSGNVADLVRLNGEFHDKLAEAGRNSILWDIMRTCASGRVWCSRPIPPGARSRLGRAFAHPGCGHRRGRGAFLAACDAPRS